MFNKRILLFLILATITGGGAIAQDSTHLSLQEAIKVGIDSSKQIMLSEARIQDAINQYAQAKDRQLPQIKATFMGSEAFIPTHTIQIKGLMKDPVHLPKTSSLYLGTLSVNEAIFAGHKMRYAKEAAQLTKEVAQLEAAHDKEDVAYTIVQSYINLYKVDQNLKILRKNINDIDGRLDETIKFKNQGLATTNDVLRFKLQKSQALLSKIDLQNNREVANYALVTLLGMPENTVLKIDSVGHNNPSIPPVSHFIQRALQQRPDLQVYSYKNKLNQVQIKNLKADKLPVLGAGVNTYYLNPNKQFFPPAKSFLVPITVGLNLSWNISSLYKTQNKVKEAKIQHYKINVAKSSAADQIRIKVNKNYHAYLQSLQHIKVLQTAVKQASENDRILELKYQNQLATTTDRIDAQTLLYQSLINLSLAKADAAISWYHLLSSTGKLKTTH